jgi:hypothetical protein
MSLISGVCEYCGVLDAAVDGDKLCWHDGRRTCCSKPSCIKQRTVAIRRLREDWKRQQRKKTPAEIHAAIVEERKARNKRYREAAKAKGLLREKGGAA